MNDKTQNLYRIAEERGRKDRKSAQERLRGHLGLVYIASRRSTRTSSTQRLHLPWIVWGFLGTATPAGFIFAIVLTNLPILFLSILLG